MADKVRKLTPETNSCHDRNFNFTGGTGCRYELALSRIYFRDIITLAFRYDWLHQILNSNFSSQGPIGFSDNTDLFWWNNVNNQFCQLTTRVSYKKGIRRPFKCTGNHTYWVIKNNCGTQSKNGCIITRSQGVLTMCVQLKFEVIQGCPIRIPQRVLVTNLQ